MEHGGLSVLSRYGTTYAKDRFRGGLFISRELGIEAVAERCKKKEIG